MFSQITMIIVKVKGMNISKRIIISMIEIKMKNMSDNKLINISDPNMIAENHQVLN
jgi:hypothetical protein